MHARLGVAGSAALLGAPSPTWLLQSSVRLTRLPHHLPWLPCPLSMRPCALVAAGKFDESRRLSNGSLMDFAHIYPMDAVFDTPDDVPQDVSGHLLGCIC